MEVVQVSVKSDRHSNVKDSRIIDENGNTIMALGEAYNSGMVITVPSEKAGTSGTKGQSLSHSGVALKAIVGKYSGMPGPAECIAVLSGNGDRAAVSARELEEGESPVLVNKGSSGGRDSFDLVFPGDARGRRTIQNIQCIQRINLRQKPMIYVIGVGCGDNALLTNEALSYMGRADVFICMEKYSHTLAGYMSAKPVLFDPFQQLAKFYMRNHPGMTEEEAERAVIAVRKRDMQSIRDALDSGKTVALLEPGDPTIFGGWRNWLSPHFPAESIRVIAGISSFNVANAMLGEHNLTESSIVITDPVNIKRDESLVKSAAETDATVVIFMGISRMKDLLPLFLKYFKEDTPVHLVYEAGIAGREKRIRTTLGKAVETINNTEETFLGLVYIGSRLP